MLGRALHSMLCAAGYVLYLVLAMGVPQRLVIWPLVTILPSRRRAIVRSWLRLHARGSLAVFRYLGNVRVTVQGGIAPESCIVLMNHQSVLDLPLAIHMVPGPYPLIPTGAHWARGIPGISPLMRLARMPLVTRGRVAKRRELESLLTAADCVARGEHSFLIFPEGHRSRDGNLLPFRTPGLRLVLTRARRPVYCVVVSDISHTRSAADTVLQLAGTDVRVVVLGPFAPPSDADADRFIEELRGRMAATCAQLRGTPAATPPDAERQLAR